MPQKSSRSVNNHLHFMEIICHIMTKGIERTVITFNTDTDNMTHDFLSAEACSGYCDQRLPCTFHFQLRRTLIEWTFRSPESPVTISAVAVLHCSIKEPHPIQIFCSQKMCHSPSIFDHCREPAALLTWR